MKQNLTIQLDSEVIRKARILAVERNISVSRLVAEELERLVFNEERYRAAQRRSIAAMNRGFHMGGGPYPRRDELYER